MSRGLRWGMSRRTRLPRARDVPGCRSWTPRTSTPTVEIKPTWRGWIHAATFPVADRRRHRADRPRAGARRQVGLRRLHGDVAAAVRQLGAVPPLQLGAEDQGDPQAHRPREHLPADRGHLHADRRARRCRTEQAALLLSLVWGGRDRSASSSACSGSTPRAGCTSRSTSLLGWAAVMYLPTCARRTSRW